jgi:hypothetical protein
MTGGPQRGDAVGGPARRASGVRWTKTARRLECPQNGTRCQFAQVRLRVEPAQGAYRPPAASLWASSAVRQAAAASPGGAPTGPALPRSRPTRRSADQEVSPRCNAAVIQDTYGSPREPALRLDSGP